MTKIDIMQHVEDDLDGWVIIKSRRGGYDGRSNLVYDGEVSNVDKKFGKDWDDLYAERIIPFEKELSVIVARDMLGHVAVYPTVETVHVDNICQTALSPASISPGQERSAQEIAHETMKILKGAGVFAIEMFACEGQVVVNEIAPRVHNSGHLTIEAFATSQFEQHIRAITGMPLGPVTRRAPAAVMINVLATDNSRQSRKGLDGVLELPDTHPHFYGKKPKPGRKIGHITVLADTVAEALDTAQRARSRLAV